ncbi:MAG: hypothetical protein E7568_04795 [Ruminococcaceae bacterium]|nr:hypothetical protein [Oscillospiraceae bacterium]
MKKFLALFLCLILMLFVTACKEDELLEGEEVIFDINSTVSETSSVESSTVESSSETSSTTESTTSNTSSATSSSTTSSQTEQTVNTKNIIDTGIKLVQSDGIYFPDINECYTYASEIYEDLVRFTFSVDEELGVKEIKVNGSTGYYWRVNDERFRNVAELKKYLDAFFTPECQKTFFDEKRFVDYDGKLYASMGAVADSTYAGCSFKLTKQTTKRIFFTGTAYFYKTPEEIENKEPFTTVPANPEKYTTKTVEFVLVVNDEGSSWRFSQFGLLK